MLDLAVAGSATVLPAVLDFDRDREASPARMNRAMEYLYLRLAAATALQPEFESAIEQLQAVGLDRLNEVLTPIFADATSIAAQLDAIRAAFLTGQPLAQLLADLENRVAGRLTAVDAQLAANLAAVTTKLGTVDTKLGELSPAAKWAAATADEARAATAQRLISAAILWAMLEPVPLTDAALIAVDLSKGVHFTLPLGGNRTLAAPTNGKPGQEGFIRVVQDGTGGRALSFAAAYKFPDLATAPSLNAATGAVTLLRYHVSAAGEVFLSGGKPVSGIKQFYSAVIVAPGDGNVARSFLPAIFSSPTATRVEVTYFAGNSADRVRYRKGTRTDPIGTGSNVIISPGVYTLDLAANDTYRFDLWSNSSDAQFLTFREL